ncbi:MurR/RpiR family transcriptional regulator [Fusobacterium sp. SYSU M8A802]
MKFIDKYNKLDDLDMELIKYLKANIDEALKLGVRGVAKKNYTSTSRIMRLAKKMNYSGFLEMMYNFKENYNDLKIELNTQGSFRVRNSKEIEEFLEILKNGKIAIYAEGFSGIIANYIYHKLLVLGLDAIQILCMEPHILKRNNLQFDLLLIISKSGETISCLNLLKTAKELGVRTSSFTGNHNSKISQASDLAFYFEDHFKDDTDIFYPNPFFGYCIVGFEVLISKYFKKYNLSF